MEHDRAADRVLANGVHVVGLPNEVGVDVVALWVDRMNGSAQEIPNGHMAYFAVDLTSGRHAWISGDGKMEG